MRPDKRFVGLSKDFWANIRTLSQEIGYCHRGTSQKAGPIKVPSQRDCVKALISLGLTATHLVKPDGQATDMGQLVLQYFNFRAEVLNRVVEPQLMDVEQAKQVYEDLRGKTGDHKGVPMNKQSGEMKKLAYFTGIINTLIRDNIEGLPCNYNPQELTTVTRNLAPFRTLARRIDGAFPGPVDPLAVWEIKEYYYTTTFGSRVADGVYETLLDGMELEELDEALHELAKGDDHRPTHIEHLLMVDAYFTWWVKGRSYLCRIIDMLHMGYVDEVLFGREVVQRLPEIVRGWVETYRSKK